MLVPCNLLTSKNNRSSCCPRLQDVVEFLWVRSWEGWIWWGKGNCQKKTLKWTIEIECSSSSKCLNVMKLLIKAFTKEYVELASSHANVTRVFWEMNTIDVDKNQPYGCVTMTGFHKMHSISSLDHLDS